MKKSRIAALSIFAMTLFAMAHDGAPASAAISYPRPQTPRAPHGNLSVMTYNVEGLPWPVALGRGDALAAIGHRLAGLRREGVQPHVILLQEAFTSDAKAIARLAGYRYSAQGPAAVDASVQPTLSLGVGFRGAAAAWNGEGDGKWADSGLMILSDYPIVATARMAFPADACAGYDCLASKGVLMALVRVPGSAAPIAVVDTHLNARAASGVDPKRADDAYEWQIAAVGRFVRSRLRPETSVIVGGDFNLGHDPERLAAAARAGGVLPGGDEAVATQWHRPGASLDPDLVAIHQRAKDKQFFRAAPGSELALRAIEVPFGEAAGGFELSDHLGFVAEYDLRAR